MIVQYANEARAKSLRNTWSIDTLLTAIDSAAEEGKRSVFISPCPADELKAELVSRGFLVEVTDDIDVTIRW